MNKNICQFYVVLGDSSFIVPNDNNVYINATNIIDYKMIQDEIFRVYKEKAKQGISVGSEIIFLVGSISDSEKANDIINKLRLNGKIQIIRGLDQRIKKEKIEEVQPAKVEEVIKKEESVKSEENNNLKLNLEVKKDKDVTNSFSDNFKSSKEDKIYEGIEDNKVPDNIYRRDFDSNNYSGYIGNSVQNKKKGSKLAVVIFIISLLLFVGSIILLFVL